MKIVNWGDWGNSGSREARAGIAREGGSPIQPEDGFGALERFLGEPFPQLVHVRGSQRLLEKMGVTGAVRPKSVAGPVASPPRDSHPETIEHLKRIFAESLQLRPEQLDSRATFENYGVDSLTVIDLNRRLEAVFGKLPATLLFERNTIDSLAAYLREHSVSAGVSVPDPPASTELAIDTAGIAIVGISGRYPMAPDLDTFWEYLRDGRSAIREMPKERCSDDASAQLRGRRGGFLDDIDRFDPLFFKIAPGEAAMMDPQERLFLETAWATLEDAGYTRAGLAGPGGKVGVFVGVMNCHYEALAAEEWVRGRHTGAYSAYWSIANRVSYHFDFRGPSMAVDTACSSSLTAIHLACESLLRGECVAALAGGVNLALHPQHFARLTERNMLASDGHCKSFGAGADGFADGEGVGAVLLKPLARAIAEGDHIHAVIRGTAVNSGGKTSGYSVPNPQAQSDVIVNALKRSGVDPRGITYVEAHGTGTALGDPIEIRALAQAFAAFTPDVSFCRVGSVKSNIGHLESAAGIAGLTKIVLQMRHRKLAPSLHAEALNPMIDFGSTPFQVQRNLEDWCGPMRAGISSFGAGGANAHLVLEVFDAPVSESVAVAPQLIVLSAQTPDRLRARAEQLLRLVERDSQTANLVDIAYTLQVGREAMRERLAVVAADGAQLAELLRRFLNGGLAEVSIIAERLRPFAKFGMPIHGTPVRCRKSSRRLVGRIGSGSRRHGWKDIPWIGRYMQGPKCPPVGGVCFSLPSPSCREAARGQAKAYPTSERLSVRGRRVPLPTYPFAGERYWLRAPAANVTSQAETLSFRADWGAAPPALASRKLERLLVIAPDRALASTLGGLASRVDWAPPANWRESLAQAPEVVVAVAPENPSMESTLFALTELAQAIQFNCRIVCPIPENPSPFCAALEGWARTVELELPHLRIRVLQARPSEWAMAIAETLARPPVAAARYRDGRFEMRQVTEYDAEARGGEPVFRRGGVYVISGGGRASGVCWPAT